MAVALDLLDYNECCANLDRLCEFFASTRADRNEATTRSHLIDSLIYDCLAWPKRDVIPEIRMGGEYADYTLFAPRAILVLEAKRQGIAFELPVSKTHVTYVLSSLCRGNTGLKAAVEQAAIYCHQRGIPLAAVSNGNQLVSFIANRSDGVPFMDGQAIAFPSLIFMQSNFNRLWNYLSRVAIEDGCLYRELAGDAAPKKPATLASQLDSYPGLRARNPFQAELQSLSEIVIEDIPRSSAMDHEFLANCYCKTGALSKHSLASKSILQARYEGLFTESSPGPAIVPMATTSGIATDFITETLSRRPILILGDVGVGKTIFLKHLISIDAEEILQHAITIYIDFGSQATLSSDLSSFIIDEIALQLKEQHDIDIAENRTVRGIYDREIRDFQRGIYGPLRDSDPAAYQTKEIDFLGTKIADRASHIKKALDHIHAGRRQQLVLFLDNCDQRGPAIQDEVFLRAQEMAERWPLLVFLPLRPETFHRSSKEGALTGYHPKAFTLSPPSATEVVRKRLSFAIKVLDGSIRLPSLPGNTSAHVEDLELVLTAFLTSIEQNTNLIECLDNISGGNIRLALDLVRGFFGSGHVNTQKIATKMRESGGYLVPMHEFIRAVIYGDCIHYSPDRSPVANLFDISAADGREHFLLPIVLSVLRAELYGDSRAGFVDTALLYSACQSLGFVPDQIDYAVVRGYPSPAVGRNQRGSLKSVAPSVRLIASTNNHAERRQRHAVFCTTSSGTSHGCREWI
jgi:hypothetical protein